jgi:serine/threonine-protein kinase
MGLTRKILLFISLLVVALAVTTLAYTTFQANRLARRTILQALDETRGVWDAYQADRYNKLKLGVRALANDPFFKPLVETGDQGSVADTLKERGQDIKADFFLATDPAGSVIARSDRPGSGEDLSQDPIVMKPLEGDESTTIWRQGGRLYHAVAIPMVTGGDLKGVLLAGYGIDETLAGYLRRLTHSQVAFLSYPAGQPALLVASSLGPRDEALRPELARPELGAGQARPDSQPFDLILGGEPHLAAVAPLQSAAGETVGAVLFLRSVSEEMAGFAQFRNSLVVVSVVVMLAALGLAYLGARRITGPVRTLVTLVERARDGSFSGAVTVASRDEIGVLAGAFNNLLADLREKEQLISFLREGMTELRKGVVSGGTTGTLAAAGATDVGSADTAAIAPTTPRVKLERGSRFAARYDIEGVLGKGGMGVVYRAADRTLDETVALKVLRPELVREDPTLLGRFKQEIRLARKITHRNVLRTHDFGESDGIPYISMEYIEGVTLKDLIVNKGALPEGVGLRIAKQMCYGLDAAHRQGVVHRDIKPHNMMILPETGELKIMDFGIARLSEVKAEAGLTSDGMVMGTPDYMSPEQAQGRPADFRSDIYSLGVVLFEVFTGRLPFRGETPMATVLHHIQTAAPAPRSVNPRLNEALERVILRCLAKDAAERYADLTEMIKDLSAVSAHAEAA